MSCRRVLRALGFALAAWPTVHCPPGAAQPPGLSPASAVPRATSVPWPARPPERLYVLPFAMEPGLEERLRQEASAGLVPQGPVRQFLGSRPRVADLVTGIDRSQPIGVSVAKLVADALVRAGWPAVFWPGPAAPPGDGWRLTGQVVSLDPGSAVERNLVGFGAGNQHVGIDVALSDPATAGGKPFLVVDSSDRGRMMPGTLPIAAAAGFNPYVVAGKLVASQAGIADVTQQMRLADGIAGSVSGAIRAHGGTVPR